MINDLCDFISRSLYRMLEDLLAEALTQSNGEVILSELSRIIEKYFQVLLEDFDDISQLLREAISLRQYGYDYKLEDEIDAFIAKVNYYYDSHHINSYSDDEMDILDETIDSFLSKYKYYSIDLDLDSTELDDLSESKLPAVDYSLLISEFILNYDGLATKDVIRKAFPSMPINAIYQATIDTPVVNMMGYYSHMDLFELSDYEISKWKNVLGNTICENRAYHSKSVYANIATKLSGVFLRIGITNYTQMFYVSQKLFKNDFSFARPYISPIGTNILSIDEQLLQKAFENGVTDIAEIGNYAREISNGIDSYIAFVDAQDEILFLNREKIVTIDALGVEKNDFSNLDNILDDFVNRQVQYRPIDEFSDYYYLPDIEFSWNEWLLYSVIRIFSKKYTVTTSTNVLATARPYVMKKGYNPNKIIFDSDYNPQRLHQEEDILDILDFEDLEDII